MEEIDYPERLYKYRALFGLAEYVKIKDNIYKDTTCSDHDNCVISVKANGDHYELDEFISQDVLWFSH